VTISEPQRPPPDAGPLAGPLGYVAIPLAGAAAGALLAAVSSPGSGAALGIGALTMPLGFFVGLGAWRSLLGVWLAAKLGRSMLRSRGSEERFRAETIRELRSIREAGPASLPFTWVFVPACAAVGAASALLLLVVTGAGASWTAALLLAVAVVFGILLRRLARSGRFPLPDE
jgi:hypothetical protein